MAVAERTRMARTVRVRRLSRNVPMNGMEMSPPIGKRISKTLFISRAFFAESMDVYWVFSVATK